MSHNSAEIFAAIDSGDPDRFVAHLTENVSFRFGNADAAQGRAHVKEAVTGFFSSIKGLTHHIKNIWEVEPNKTVLEIEVEYRRHDGETVYVPNVDILTWDGDLVSNWQILIDVAAVYAPIEEVGATARTKS